LVAAFGVYSSNKSYFDNKGSIEERYHSLSKEATANKIAVLDASGVIMSGQGFVKRQIDQIRKDKSIKGIVLRVDSPGGTVYGSDFMYHHLVKLREERELPMVVSMGSIAASGGYYIAMAVGDQENCIFAEPMTTTGSIGVIIPHYNVAGLMKRFDVVDDSIATHPRKDMLSMTREMTEDDRQVIKQYIDHAFNRFKDVIKSGRPKFAAKPEDLDVLATGEVFTAQQAKASGLVDEIGFVEDAIDRVLEMADLDESTTRVVKYEKPVSLVDAIALGKSSEPAVLKEMLELTTMRAYYLSNPLPSVLSRREKYLDFDF
jgi:protease-4